MHPQFHSLCTLPCEKGCQALLKIKERENQGTYNWVPILRLEITVYCFLLEECVPYFSWRYGLKAREPCLHLSEGLLPGCDQIFHSLRIRNWGTFISSQERVTERTQGWDKMFTKIQREALCPILCGTESFQEGCLCFPNVRPMFPVWVHCETWYLCTVWVCRPLAHLKTACSDIRPTPYPTICPPSDLSCTALTKKDCIGWCRFLLSNKYIITLRVLKFVLCLMRATSFCGKDV